MANLGKYSLQIRDYSDELTSHGITTLAPDAASLVGYLANVDAYKTAVQAIILGVISADEVILRRRRLSGALPVDRSAQRERKWLVVYDDSSQWLDPPTNSVENPGWGKVFTVELGTADLSLLTTHHDEVYPSDVGIDVALTNYAIAFNALAKTPYGGGGRLLKWVAVGRNT